MSLTFTKLFSSITESTVWCEPDRTRLAWICMLAMADKHGRVFASIPGLANRARIPVEDARTAIDTFLAPDRDSRTELYDGRRIEPIDGGWRLLNHEKYRNIRDDEAIKESKRKYINERRARERAERGGVDQSVENVGAAVESVDQSRPNAEAEAEADTEPKKESSTAAPTTKVVVDPETQKPAPRSAKRCPAGFAVTPEMLAWADEKVPGLDTRYETEKFRDHTFATARSDWTATWRAWMRKADEDRRKRAGFSEPAWRTEQRQRTAQAAPYAVSDPAADFFDDHPMKAPNAPRLSRS